MKSSIRKFLLINFLIAIGITTFMTAVGNYYLDKKDIQQHLDTLMAVSALSYEALLGNNINPASLQQIQNSLNQIPLKIQKQYEENYLIDLPPQKYINKFDFQVWDVNNHVILHSFDPLKIESLPQKDGFNNLKVDSEMWRIYTTTNNNTHVRTILAEHFDTRNELSFKITLDDVYIMLLIFPLSGLLIWIIIGRGLSSLNRIAQELSNRAPANLEPVNLEQVPEEIKPIIDELNQLFHRLHEGFEREKRFAADAAHELRTPLAALKAQAQVALNTEDIAEKNMALKKLIASVNRSAHVVQQLLIMSRLVPEATSSNEFVQVNLTKISKEVLALLAPFALEKNIELEFEPDEAVPEFMGNATTISILIRNLVDNAIRYCKENGTVLVKVYSKPEEVILEVHDNGPGIPKEFRNRVFERFFRVLGNKSIGSGLGLAIVKQVIELHGGTIELDSPKTGTGLIVRVYFPLFSKNILNKHS